ncbi:MAG: glycosyltransferase family 2 protein [bacterium]
MLSISIILPVFNAQNFIQHTLEQIVSLLRSKSDVDKVQIILVNDGSQDQTLHVMNEFIQKNFYDSKFSFNMISYSKNRNIGYALRRGIQIAKNDIIFMVDCDLPFGIEVISDSLQFIKDYDLISVDRTKRKDSYIVPLHRAILHVGLIKVIKLMFGNAVEGLDDFVVGFKVIKKHLLEKIQDYLSSDTSLFHFEILLFTKLINSYEKKYKMFFLYPKYNPKANHYSTFTPLRIVRYVFKVLIELIKIRLKLAKIMREYNKKL